MRTQCDGVTKPQGHEDKRASALENRKKKKKKIKEIINEKD